MMIIIFVFIFPSSLPYIKSKLSIYLESFSPHLVSSIIGSRLALREVKIKKRHSAYDRRLLFFAEPPISPPALVFFSSSCGRSKSTSSYSSKSTLLSKYCAYGCPGLSSNEIWNKLSGLPFFSEKKPGFPFFKQLKLKKRKIVLC